MSKICLMLAALLLAPPLLADDLPDVTEEGLVRVEDSNWAVVYIDPDADFAEYDTVMLLETFVAFRKNWQRDINRTRRTNRVSDADMEQIKTSLASEFDSVFREVLESDDGYQIVDEASHSTLLLRPAIVDLDVVAPDTMSAGRNMTFSESSGAMTIYLEIWDSVTGDLLAKGIDRRSDGRAGFTQWQTSVSNSAAARRILRGWAQSLREGLDEAHARADGPD